MSGSKSGIFVLLTLLALVAPSSAGVRYATENGANTGDCTGGWSSACSLGHAIAQAAAGDQVWVKAGTYGPITLKDGVKIIGGFDGGETAASQSDYEAKRTVIDGGGARAITSSNNSADTILRGFVIRNGADESTDGGGGLHVAGGSPKFVECVFEDNSATFWGAAAAIVGGSTAEFVSCTFRNNGDAKAKLPYGGGAVFVKSSSPAFVNCLFSNNSSGAGPGVAVMAGAPTIVNCTFAYNTATVTYGGAVHDEGGRAVLRNSILWGNTAESGGDQIWNLPDRARTTVTDSNVQGGWPGDGNINTDPQFGNVAAGAFDLATDSPCKHAGRTAALPVDSADLDWDGNVTEKVPLGRQGVVRKGAIDMGVCAVVRR
jgi:hypothetical protein